MAKSISDKIEVVLGQQIEDSNLGKGAPHPDTILNFLNKRKQPSTRLLNIVSWYLKEDPSEFYSFESFKTSLTTEKLLVEKMPVKKRPWSGKKSVYLLVPAIILVFTTILIFTRNQGQTVPYSEKFSSSDLTHLKRNDWFLFNDSIDLSKWDNPIYRDNGYLTLETHLGDSWLVNRNYKPKVINILSRKISCGSCCVIETKIVDFTPYQRYQKAGFYIFYGKKVFPSIRFSVTSDSKETTVNSVRRNNEYDNQHVFTKTEIKKRSDIGNILGRSLKDLKQPVNLIDSITLRLTIEKDQYFFEYRVNDREYIAITSENIALGTPEYVGITAQQGRPDIPFPIWPVAEIIPAKFESFSISSCN